MHEQQQQRLFAITSIAHLHTSRLSLAPPKVQMFDDDLKLVPPSRSVNYFHLFELDEMARDTDDDDVASLAVQLLNERRALKREIEAVEPRLGLPGAK